jgi:Protein of unknown function (DUF4232)
METTKRYGWLRFLVPPPMRPGYGQAVSSGPAGPAIAEIQEAGTARAFEAARRPAHGVFDPEGEAAGQAAGTIFYPLDLTNTSGSACTMYGYPGVAFVSSPGGSVIGASARRRSPPVPALATLAPGVTAHATLAVSDVLIGNNRVHKVQVKWVQA